MTGDGTAGLWLAVLASGVYHGASPGMGWPLAVSAGMFAGRGRAVLAALPPIAAGHFAAIALALLPFAALAALVDWQREIRIGAGLLVVGFGVWQALDRRHPRAIARIPPGRLALWSFAVALAHGAGLLLVPVMLGLCAPGAGLGGPALLAQNGAITAGVAALHAAAMVATAGAIAWTIWRWLGPGALRAAWVNLERIWGLSLIVAGGTGLALAL